jgi:hypothetical protein
VGIRTAPFPPRPHQGRLHPFRDEAGATSGTLSSRTFAPRPWRISPGRRPWGDGADLVKERINNRSVLVRIHRVPGEPLAPLSGYLAASPVGEPLSGQYSRRPRLPRLPAGGRGSRDLHTEDPLICPASPSNFRRGRRLALPTLSGGGALMAVPVGTAPAPHTVPVGTVRVHPPAATSNVRDPLMGDWGGSRRNTHPRTPAPINVNLGAPGRYPGGASAPMGSVFFVF